MLRAVEPQDIAVFYEQQDDVLASEMAAFPVRERAAHERHWAKVLADDTAAPRTIVDGTTVIGNIGSWLTDGERDIGYWIGRRYWGKGYATRALTAYLAEIRDRPLYTHVAEHNVASLRVLDKCGFSVIGRERQEGDPIVEIVLRLDS